MSETAEPEPIRQEIITYLRREHARYSAGPDVHRQLAQKSFTGLFGPTGIGKTTIGQEISRRHSEIVPINTTTTRRRKPEDPAGFKTADEGVTFEMMRDAVAERQLVNYSVSPNGHVYGTFPEGFTARYNIGPMLPDSVDMIINSGIDYRFVYVVSPGEMWRRFIENSRLDYDDLKPRMKEAVDSIGFAQDNMDIFYFVENLAKEEGNGAEEAAEKIADAILHNTHEILLPSRAEQDLEEMLRVARDFAS